MEGNFLETGLGGSGDRPELVWSVLLSSFLEGQCSVLYG